jgi:hypothetical protein
MDQRNYPNGSFGSFKPRYVAAADGSKVFVMPGVVRNIRVRATQAQVNAGLVVLQAIPGFGYRIVDCDMIAIGGAAATATSVDLLGTKGGSASRPVVNTVAALTQSTRVHMGRAQVAGTSTILADGGSHTVHDANTSISITKQSGGSNLATATAIDLNLTYVAE